MPGFDGAESTSLSKSQRFPDELLFRAAHLYYLEDATQAEVAKLLSTSRPSVSRMLAEARALGIVNIEVRDPSTRDTAALAEQLAQHLGLRRVWVTPRTLGTRIGSMLAPAVAEAIKAADLSPGDAMLVSSGVTMYEIAQTLALPLPGVLMAPTVAGLDEPEALYQTNEITRKLAVNATAVPYQLHAPAVMGAELYQMLLREPSVRRVMQLWKTAKCALLGIGAPPRLRTSMPSVISLNHATRQAAAGDMCTRIFDRFGEPLDFPGSDRMFAIELRDLRRIPYAIGIAVGEQKVESISIAARAGYFNFLVTDVETAQLLIAAPSDLQAAPTRRPLESGQPDR